MVSFAKPDDDLYTLGQLACELDLDVKWLRQEAEAGRLPCLKPTQRRGRQMFFSLKAVREALARRAAESWIGAEAN